MAFTNVGCISAVQVFATQAWPAGNKTIGPVALPDKFRYGMLLVDVSQLTDLLAALTISMQLSFDGGATFQDVGGFGLDLTQSGYLIGAGGLTDAAGNPVRIAASKVALPQNTSVTRQIQGVLTLSLPATLGLTFVMW